LTHLSRKRYGEKKAPMSLLSFGLHIFIALALGAAIGIERQWRQRRAGLRTHALVALGAAAFVSVSVMVPQDSSPTRIASYVVSGIGFLGAGVILREGFNVRGLNTAATLWCSAAAGVLTGWGFMAHAAVVTTAVIGCNVLLRPLARLIERQPLDEASEVEAHYRISATCRDSEEPHIRSLILQEVARAAVRLRSLSSEDINGSGKVRVQSILISTGRNDETVEHITSHLSMESRIIAVGWEIIDQIEE
jgi:putative Mg2+ transporter-C (MgtC) family protein